MMGSLEEVHMPQNGINYPGITALAKAMQHNTGLRILNLNDNTFTEKGAVAMAQVHSADVHCVVIRISYETCFSLICPFFTRIKKKIIVKKKLCQKHCISLFNESFTMTIICLCYLILVVYLYGKCQP